MSYYRGIFGAVRKNPVKDFCWWDLFGVCLSVCLSVCAVVNGSLDLAARAIVLQAISFDEAKFVAA